VSQSGRERVATVHGRRLVVLECDQDVRHLLDLLVLAVEQLAVLGEALLGYLVLAVLGPLREQLDLVQHALVVDLGGVVVA